MTEPTRDEIFETARRALLDAFPQAWALYVYGSFARGDEWPNSDLDLAVLLPPGVPLTDKLQLQGALSRQIGRNVDVVALRNVGLDLVREVLRDGRVLAVPRKAQTLAWEAERMTDYAAFHPRRSDILDAYLKEPLRGST